MLKFQVIAITKSSGDHTCGTPYIAQAKGTSNYLGYLWDHGIYVIFALPERVYAVHQEQHFSKLLRLSF